MQHKHLRFGEGFKVVLGDDHSQAAQTTLAPGATEGGPDNRHKGADRWLFVVRGEGLAIVEGEKVEVREGTLVLIRRGERNEIGNTGREPLRTLNFCVPPGYTPEGDEVSAGKADRWGRTASGILPPPDKMKGCRRHHRLPSGRQQSAPALPER